MGETGAVPAGAAAAAAVAALTLGVLPTLPAGRLARDARWGAAVRAAWAADPEIRALPRRGAELAVTELPYEHAGVRLHGLLVCHDAGAAPRRAPGVILAHTGAGPRDLFLLWRASALAARGHVVLVADLFGDEDGAAWDAPFSRARMDELRADRALLGDRLGAALSMLRADERVDGARCAALGWCLGGRAALDLARRGADLRAAVSFHGVLDALPDELLAPHVRARVLVCDGDLDPLQSDGGRAAMREQLRRAGADFEVVTYGRAAHGFTCPAQRLNDADGFDFEPMAAARAWEGARTFLRDALDPDGDGAPAVGVGHN
ncbi:hypothetical protein KFE25_010859 [Diacronema lutheri]|uniref:Dienelactone hydrolase domain-containing protein n=2 Tax=Diacronema lutheri TaxID=2081491 RepID=A0A8J5XH78_DIALT|nr:hypothetical protein KFE25_010859 [Diacronema lutheri]